MPCIMEHAIGTHLQKLERGIACPRRWHATPPKWRPVFSPIFPENYSRYDMQHANGTGVACRAGMRHANRSHAGTQHASVMSHRHGACQRCAMPACSFKWSAKWHAFVHAACTGHTTVQRWQPGVVQRVNRMPSVNFNERILKSESSPPEVA
jgi:hypothetical protein